MKGRYVLISHPMMQKRIRKLGDLKRRTMKGSSWENFQLGKDRIGSLWKNDKRKGSQKAESEKERKP